MNKQYLICSIYYQYKKILSSSTQTDCLVHSLRWVHPMLDTTAVGAMKGCWCVVHMWTSRLWLASRTVLICVQLCQTTLVQAQRESCCRVACLSLPGVPPVPDLVFSCDEKQYVHLFPLPSLSLLPPQINNILACLESLRVCWHWLQKLQTQPC